MYLNISLCKYVHHNPSIQIYCGILLFTFLGNLKTLVFLLVIYFHIGYNAITLPPIVSLCLRLPAGDYSNLISSNNKTNLQQKIRGK